MSDRDSLDSRQAFFRREGDWIVGGAAARGPWTEDACHGGPVTAAIAGAIESAIPEKQLTRLTVVFRRPVPVDGFRIETSIERDGKSAATGSATLFGRDGKVYATATSMHIITADFPDMPTTTIPAPDPNERIPGAFPVQRARHGLTFFGNSIQVGFVPGDVPAPGPKSMWMRAQPIFEGEAPTPFQTLCPLSDCGNGISANAGFSEATFVNPDLTIVAHRLPASEWLASQAVSFWETSGIGASCATLFDEHGALGTALQTLIVRPMQTT